MIDLHCHILNGVDDGAGSLDEAIAMAEIAVADGIRTIVATPHTTNGNYDNRPAFVVQAVKELQEVLDHAEIPLQLLPGAEVHFVPDLVEQLRQEKIGTLNNSRYLLLELPPTLSFEGCKQEMFSLRLEGVVPILAHPERHPPFQKDMNPLFELVEMGVLCQLTAQSITGAFGRAIRKMAERMVRSNLVHILASDAHSSHCRVPELQAGVDRVRRLTENREKAENMVTAIPAAILNDNAVSTEAPRGIDKGSFFFTK